MYDENFNFTIMQLGCLFNNKNSKYVVQLISNC